MTMNRNADLQVPWSQDGQALLHFPDLVLHPNLEWRGNPVFEATLKLKGTERGRSAAYFRWEDVNTEQRYPMFITDVGHMIMLGMHLEPGGVVSGRWFVVKRGKNYGITPAPPQDGTTEATEAP